MLEKNSQNNILFLISSKWMNGMSMYSTLKPYDRISIKAYSSSEKISKGDVVAFSPPYAAGVIVHRVVSIDAAGRIGTRGDNNATNDPWVLERAHILGKITHVYRGGDVRIVHGGTLGQCRAFFARFLKFIGVRARFLMMFLRNQLVPRWLVGVVSRRFIRVRHFVSNGADFELHILFGNKVIGRYVSRDTKWYVHESYKGWVDIGKYSRLMPSPVFMQDAHCGLEK